MPKSVAILQSNYIPWKGYFDLIRKVDLFIFYDDLQYTKNDWRNRNKIKTPMGARWLTIPCGSSWNRLINEVRVDNASWQKKHFDTLKQHYAAAPYWKTYAPFLEEVYLGENWEYLSDLNQTVIKRISQAFLGITTEFDNSERYHLTASKGERVLQLLERVGATHYVSGPAAKSYLVEDEFVTRGITLEFMDYAGYPKYPQLYPPFEPAVTILDMLLNLGPATLEYMQPADKR
ncbi:hypothetical protein CEP88_13080 [Roseobacter denitrificans]|uniref:WbqC-like protein n=1 Tax=Roseobacter denitrificans (strain ATCC 33942 / OCh 114) TaxID=375451 RepID=Q16CL7_ROSDO|nr:WbqC family protein [Roseobacter denitrificans]ABG30276.1 conserved hypothetical protein [Roseobacter denitrificans OCh 114]AVL53454.1 hypothetical protein CEP88_13080 [Roseobacter denitrificans]SFF71177.1 WbqC-like protein family protein [Roseobacter denitrificans OCh 114]